MRTASYSTDSAAPAERAAHWNRAIAEAYFPLHLSFRQPAAFNGALSRATLGEVGLSHLRSDALQYERHRHHIGHSQAEEYLITLPRRGPVEFSQFGREIRCDPGGFIIERGDEPYRFTYANRNDLFVLKASKAALSGRLRDPDRFCARVFNAQSGIGRLFASLVENALQQADNASDTAALVLGRHMLDLLALSLEDGTDASQSSTSVVRAAHVRRIMGFIRGGLANPDLTPEVIAGACGISKRYLHELFKELNGTVSHFIREERLIAARDLLTMPDSGAIADIAYRFCFADQAQFSRLFRDRFGQTPSGYRAKPGHGGTIPFEKLKMTA